MKRLVYLFFLLVAQTIFSQIDYTQFEGKKGKISLFKEYELSNIYDYGIDTEKGDSLLVKVLTGNYPEALISQKFSSEISKNEKDSIVFSVKLKTRLIVEIQNRRHSLVSYTTSNNNTISVIDYVYNNEWSENTILSKEIILLKSIIENANANIIFEFYNKRDNSKYPEISKLKPLVKNVNRVLNIEKLVEVLKQNKVALSKYLD